MKKAVQGEAMVRKIIAVVVTGAILAAVPATAEAPPVFLLRWGTAGIGPGQFDTPRGLGIDPSGNVYVADVGNGRVQKFSNDGVFLDQLTGGGRFDVPQDIAIDQTGRMYVGDSNVIYVLDSNGNFERQWPAVVGFCLALDPAGQFICTEIIDTLYVYRTSDGAKLARWLYKPPFQGSITNVFCCGSEWIHLYPLPT